MRVSLNWLREFVEINMSPEELCEHMTMLGLEIEAVERLASGVSNVVIGQIQSIEPHPSADKLVVCKTDIGNGDPLQIICGAKNMKEGDRVPTACVGATLPGGFNITKRKMRGVESQGMMCSEQELGLGEDQSGLMILPTDAPIGGDAIEYLELDDTIFEVEVTPNRGDWAGVIGVARELAASFGEEFELPETRVSASDTPVTDLSSVVIDDSELCPRYIGRVMTNITVGPSPAWLKTRLAASGIRSINNVVDVTNYVLMETGHPLHAFDHDKLVERRIVVRRAESGESLVTIDGEKRELDRDVLVIADAKQPVAIAGIMGGEYSEVGEDTRNIFIESAHFNARSIRRTARALGMTTEASQRFQRGADPEMARYAIDCAAELLQDITAGELADGVLDEYPAPESPRQVQLRFTRTNDLLGAEIAPHRQLKMIKNLGFESVEETSTECSFKVPSWRHDVTQEADLIEEIARLYGYDKIPANVPRVARTEAKLAPEEEHIRELRNLLVGLGLMETVSMSFSSPEAAKLTGIEDADERMVRLLNPLSENQSGMRTSLIPGMLSVAAHNYRHGSHDMMLFEIGPVYTAKGNQELPAQAQRLALCLTGARRPPHWSQERQEVDFFDLKGFVEAIFEQMRVECRFSPHETPTFVPGQCGAIELADASVGALGEVAPNVQKAYEIGQRVFIAEIELEPLFARTRTHAQFRAIPPYPPYLRDMAVLVPKDTPAGEVMDAVRNAGGQLLADVELFDVYTGKPVPEDKKSLGLNLVFQAPDRTLSDDDTQALWDAILERLNKDFGATLR